jgi:ethanolamine ammonia-lyase small subunit
MSIERERIAQVVRELLTTELGASERRPSGRDASAPKVASYPSAVGASALHAARCERPAPPLHEVDDPTVASIIPQLVGVTSSQIAVGHRGLRFKTDLYLRMREGSADAKDAVHSEVPDDWAAAHGLLSLKSRCEDRTEHLLFPNHGRRLDERSLAALGSARSSRPDVQVIIGDGLSSNAVLKNGTESLQELSRALGAAGYRSGPGMFVKYARIGVADEIGVLTGARATVIVVGERPGLGTGDSLSFYIAVNPKLDQDNAEKNCISNVRGIGIVPREAADLTVNILRRAFELGGGGVAIGFGFGRT